MKTRLLLLTLCIAFGAPACAAFFPPSATPPATRPPAPPEDQLVRQQGAYLVWMRCPLHQIWSSSGCEGEPALYTHDNAHKACPEGFRVPSRDELVNLLDECNDRVVGGSYGTCNSCDESAVCGAMFDPPEGYFWSSDVINSLEAWAASLQKGHVASGPSPSPKLVLCVQSVSE